MQSVPYFVILSCFWLQIIVSRTPPSALSSLPTTSTSTTLLKTLSTRQKASTLSTLISTSSSTTSTITATPEKSSKNSSDLNSVSPTLSKATTPLGASESIPITMDTTMRDLTTLNRVSLPDPSGNGEGNCPVRSSTCTQFQTDVETETADGKGSTLLNDFTSLKLNNPDKCYVLVQSPMTYPKAREVCNRAKGRIARIEAKDAMEMNSLVADIAKHLLMVDRLENHGTAVLRVRNSTTPETTESSNYSVEVMHNSSSTEQTDISDGDGKLLEGIWIGLREENNGLAWDCPGLVNAGDSFNSPGNFCLSGNHTQQASVAVCMANTTGEEDPAKECLCWHQQQTELGFLCETSAPCSLPEYDSCEAFGQVFKKIGKTAHLVPNANGLDNGLADSTCYVLVSDNDNRDTASDVCNSVGGRLAWLTHHSNIHTTSESHALLTFFHQIFGQRQEEGSGVWIGLERWQMKDTDNGSMYQWICPAGQGQNYTFAEPEGWIPNNLHHNQSEISFAYLQGSDNSIAFDTHHNKSLPFYCEGSVKKKMVPETSPAPPVTFTVSPVSISRRRDSSTHFRPPTPAPSTRRPKANIGAKDEEEEGDDIPLIFGIIALVIGGFLLLAAVVFAIFKMKNRAKETIPEEGQQQQPEVSPSQGAAPARTVPTTGSAGVAENPGTEVAAGPGPETPQVDQPKPGQQLGGGEGYNSAQNAAEEAQDSTKVAQALSAKEPLKAEPNSTTSEATDSDSRDESQHSSKEEQSLE